MIIGAFLIVSGVILYYATRGDDSAAARDDSLRLAGTTRFVVVTGIGVVVAGLALAAFRFAGGAPPEQGTEGAIGSLALGVTIAVPGVLAVLAVRDRPVLLLPAATTLAPLSALSFVTLPLVIPAVMLAIPYGRRSRGHAPASGTAGGTFVVVYLLLAAAVVVLFVHDDPRTYSTATGGGSTSDVITYAESLPSLALSAAAIAAGWFLAKPRRQLHRGNSLAEGRAHSKAPD